MGTTSLTRQRGQKGGHAAFFAGQFPSLEFVKTATVGFTFFAAVRHRADPNAFVFALVVPFRWYRASFYNFSYKDMTEFEGPYYYNCPESILRELSRLDPADKSHAYAIDWRFKAQLAHSRKATRTLPAIGETVTVNKPVVLRGGETSNRLTRVDPKSLRYLSKVPRLPVYRTESGSLVKIRDIGLYGVQS